MKSIEDKPATRKRRKRETTVASGAAKKPPETLLEKKPSKPRIAKTSPATMLERGDDNTILEHGNTRSMAGGALTTFRGMTAKRLPTAGAEADIYVLDTHEGKQVLKLYRYGISPKEEVLKKIMEVSRKSPEHVAIVYDSGFDTETGCWYEIMEYAKHGSLAHWIQSGKAKNFSFETIVKELSEAISSLQDSDMVHRDIKPSNVLLRSVDPLDLILTDFGITSIMHDVSIRATDRNFTPEYAPPEMGVASKAGDWWSLGIILYEIITGKTPFHGLEHSAIFVALATKSVDIPTSIDPRLQLLLQGLLTRDIDRRWRADEVRQWLRGESPQTWHDMDAPPGGAPNKERSFEFQRNTYDSLEALAGAMAASDTAWQDGAKFLGRGYLIDALKKRGQYDDAILVESLACENSDEYVFRFVHSFIRNGQPSYRGLPMTAENLFAACLDGKAKAGSVGTDFITKTLGGGWSPLVAFLKERNIALQPLFESCVALPPATPEALPRILLCALHPDKIYWGLLNPSERENITYRLGDKEFSCETTRAYLLAHTLDGNVMTLNEWKNMGGSKIVLPQSIGDQLSGSGTYAAGIAALRKRHAGKALLTEVEVKRGEAVKQVFSGTDEAYDERVKVTLWNFSQKNVNLLGRAKSHLQAFLATNGTSTTPRLLQRYLEALDNGIVPLDATDLEICKNIPFILKISGRKKNGFLARFFDDIGFFIASVVFTALLFITFNFIFTSFAMLAKITAILGELALGLLFFQLCYDFVQGRSQKRLERYLGHISKKFKA